MLIPVRAVRHETLAAVFQTAEPPLEVAAALVAEGVQRAIAEQAVEVKSLRHLVAWEVLTFMVAIVGIVILMLRHDALRLLTSVLGDDVDNVLCVVVDVEAQLRHQTGHILGQVLAGQRLVQQAAHDDQHVVQTGFLQLVGQLLRVAIGHAVVGGDAEHLALGLDGGINYFLRGDGLIQIIDVRARLAEKALDDLLAEDVDIGGTP